MKKYFYLALLLFLYSTLHGFNIDYAFSLGEIGIENFNFENNIGVNFSIFNFSWIEKNTGIGLGFALTNKKMALPFELMWNPFSARFSRARIFGTFGIYNRIGIGAAGENNYFVTPIKDLIVINTTGIRYIFSLEPYGRSKEKRYSTYHHNGSIYMDYSTDNTWRIGVTIDFLFLGRLLFIYPIIFIKEEAIPE